MSDTLKLGTQNEKRANCGTLRRADGSHCSCCGFTVLQGLVLGTANSEYWNCLGVRSFLLELPEASMIRSRADWVENRRARPKVDVLNRWLSSKFSRYFPSIKCHGGVERPGGVSHSELESRFRRAIRRRVSIVPPRQAAPPRARIRHGVSVASAANITVQPSAEPHSRVCARASKTAVVSSSDPVTKWNHRGYPHRRYSS